LGGAPGEDAEEEDAQKRAVSDRGDLESDFDDAAHAVQAEDGKAKEDRGPEQGRVARDAKALLVAGAGAEAEIEIHDRTRRERVECGAQVRHRGGENRCDQESGDTVRHVLDNEGRVDAVRFAEVGGRSLIVGPKHHADDQEQCELEKNCEAA
jgi:hypothetical protein